MQGLKQNRKQFYGLVLVNAFVGSMVGLERSVIPGLAESFHLNGHTALLSFIAAFGSTKAIFNLLTGRLTKKITRKKILLLGWLAALPVPFLLMYAPNWGWVIAANIFLGINQGLAWSSTVIMKIDLVGEKNRGLAMGINEFAGYVAVGLAAWLAGEIAAANGYRFFPFIPGIFFSVAGLLLTLFFIKDTSPHVAFESERTKAAFLPNIWRQATYKHFNLGSVTINGFVNNLNDGVIWGLLPVILMAKNFSIGTIGLAAGVYPAVWGLGQLFTGRLGDSYCKKQLISGGMGLQALGLILLVYSNSLPLVIASMVTLGLGTALVYPNFLSVIAENTHPQQRAEGLSIFRFWRDSGYVAGAFLSGLLADWLGVSSALVIVALLTAGAGLLAQSRMCCTLKLFWSSRICGEVY